MREEGKWCTSTDGENYDSDFFDTETEAVMDYFRDNPDVEGVHVGQATMISVETVVDEESIIEMIGEHACEEWGEWAESWWEDISSNRKFREEVGEALVSLFKKHKLEPTFWSIYNAHWVERGLL